jgi:O-acetyl-ADP-ribose deacetylase (regulator of RNase III)
MIREQHGNLLDAEVDALVNTVNTVGVMGKGIALQCKRAFPENYKAYKRVCDAGEVELGRMFIWDAGAIAADGPRFVIKFPTTRYWRSNSTVVDIQPGSRTSFARSRTSRSGPSRCRPSAAVTVACDGSRCGP